MARNNGDEGQAWHLLAAGNAGEIPYPDGAPTKKMVYAAVVVDSKIVYSAPLKKEPKKIKNSIHKLFSSKSKIEALKAFIVCFFILILERPSC